MNIEFFTAVFEGLTNMASQVAGFMQTPMNEWITTFMENLALPAIIKEAIIQLISNILPEFSLLDFMIGAGIYYAITTIFVGWAIKLVRNIV